MICPRCSVADISPLTGACELCGFVPGGTVVVDHPDATDELARRELAHEFRIDVLLGQGETSTVYLARARESDERIVLKVMPRPADRRDIDDQLRQAVAIVGALNHPHLVAIRRHGATDSLIWYAGDWVRGRSLRNVLRTEGPMSLAATLRLVTQVAGVLDYVHRRGIVHGSLKPENVLIDSEGWAHVCDTMVSRVLHQPARPGAAGSAGEARAGRASTAGQRAPRGQDAEPPENDPSDAPAAAARPAPRSPYAAPEDDLAGPLTAAADQFALAALVRECLGAQADLPVHVQQALRRAQAERPINRFPDVPDFVAALEWRPLAMPDARPSGRASSTVPVLTLPDWKPPPRPNRPGLRKLLIGGIAAVVMFTAWRLVERSRASQWQTLPASFAPPVAVDSATAAAAARVADSLADAQARPVRLRPERSQRRAATADAPSRPAERTQAPRAERTPSPAAAPAPDGPPGRLFVNATPWGQLYLDGQLVGNTPKANLSLAPGSHTVRIVRDGFEPWERTVQVTAGQDLRLTDIQLVERRP